MNDQIHLPFSHASHALVANHSHDASVARTDSAASRVTGLLAYKKMLAAFLVVLALALAYKWMRPVAEQPPASIKQTVLRQLKSQIKKDSTRRGANLLEKRERIYRAFASKWSTGIDGVIDARDIMSGSLKCVAPDLPRARVAREMKAAGVHHLLVCSVDGKLAGIISDRDLQKTDCVVARDLMTADPWTVQVDDGIDKVVTLMITKHISCVPVMMGKTLIGVISSSDIAVTLQCAMTLFADIFSSESTVIEEAFEEVA